MKKSEEKVNDTADKKKVDKKRVIGKFIALFMLVAMLLGSCSTCIFYMISNS